MPCRCDGYEVTDNHMTREKLVHTEGQLCNARSLIHKLLKYIPGGLPPDLEKRAHDHVALLLAHKRAEHEADKAELERKLLAVRGSLKLHEDRVKAEQARQKALVQTSKTEEIKLSEKLAAFDPTDEELLG